MGKDGSDVRRLSSCSGSNCSSYLAASSRVRVSLIAETLRMGRELVSMMLAGCETLVAGAAGASVPDAELVAGARGEDACISSERTRRSAGSDVEGYPPAENGREALAVACMVAIDGGTGCETGKSSVRRDLRSWRSFSLTHAPKPVVRSVSSSLREANCPRLTVKLRSQVQAKIGYYFLHGVQSEPYNLQTPRARHKPAHKYQREHNRISRTQDTERNAEIRTFLSSSDPHTRHFSGLLAIEAKTSNNDPTAQCRMLEGRQEALLAISLQFLSAC